MGKIKNWWSIWGQLFGFLFMVIYLNGFWLIFLDKFQKDWRYPLAWLIQFFLLVGLYSWQSRKHGWKLPKDIKDTHGW